jgi:ATP-dependent protease ClpP protease subunit
MSADVFQSFLPLLVVLSIGGLIWAKVRRDARNAPAVLQLPGGAPVPEYKGPLAFFRRHYNGDYSLARSYWVNTLLVSMFAPVAGIVLLPWLTENLPARYGSGGVLIVTTLGFTAWLWAISGTWASANKHVQRGGKSGWATAAKVMIVIGILRMFGDLAEMMPTLQEHIQVATGAQFGPSTKLEVRADGRSILLAGGINDGSAEQLDKALQLAPAVTTVVLSSTGGWIREGQMLADVIRKFGLNTYVEGHCESACTIAFLAGRTRAAAPTAKIGFHASRGVGSTDASPSLEETAQLRTLYHDAGLPDSFVRQALDTPHETMWYPPHEVLLTAGVLTRRSMGGETAAMSTAVRSKEALVAEFEKIEMYAVLAERFPKDFESLMEAAWGKMQQGATDAEVITAARALLATTLPRLLPLASDETLVAYQALMQEQLEALRERDVTACVEMAFPSGRPMNIVGNLPPELTKREVVLMTKVFREADEARSIQPSQLAIEHVAQLAAAGMTQEQLVVFTDEAARRRGPPSLTCTAAIKFFAGLNAIPVVERGPALRVLYAGS